jgi:hypothetical protein
VARVAGAALPAWERAAGFVFAAGLVLTGLASAWYHLAPSSATLVWDRLPLSALFPTVFAVAIGDRVSAVAGRALLAPLVLGALAWWRHQRPHGEASARRRGGGAAGAMAGGVGR